MAQFPVSPFGGRNRRYETVVLQFPAAADAVDGWGYVAPDDGNFRTLMSVDEVHSTISTSGTLALRKVTATALPGAAASSTVVELLSGTTINLAATVNVVQSATLVTDEASRRFEGGDLLGLDFGGTMTGLAGCVVVLTFLVTPSA